MKIKFLKIEMSVAPIFFNPRDKVFRGGNNYDDLIAYAKAKNPYHHVLYSAMGGFVSKGCHHYKLITNDDDVKKAVELSSTEGYLQWISVSEETYKKIQSDPTGEIFWKYDEKDTPLHFPVSQNIKLETEKEQTEKVGWFNRKYARFAIGIAGFACLFWLTTTKPNPDPRLSSRLATTGGYLCYLYLLNDIFDDIYEK